MRHPATVLAALALFISLGGVSYGVATGSINSREIENGTIQSRDVRDGALQGRDIANRTLRSRDIADGVLGGVDIRDESLAGADVAADSLGDREINEPALDINRLGGISATRYVKNVVRVETRSANDAVTPKVAPPARCPEGKRLIGGGARVEAATFVPVALAANSPAAGGWSAAAYATAPTGNWQLVSVAICG
jgi:hypothetical protein